MEGKMKVLEALAKLQGEIESVPLEKNPNLKYDAVSYDGLLDQVRDKALANGLMLIPTKCHQTNCSPYERSGRSYNNAPPQSVHMKYDSYVFDFRIWHVSGEYLDISVPAVGVDEQDKGPGKAMTYAAKSAWLQVLMLKRGDDPDMQGGRPKQQPPYQFTQQLHQQPPQQQRPPQNYGGNQNYQQPPPQQNQYQQPQQRPQQPQGGIITDNPDTWPPDWKMAYSRVKELTGNPAVIEAMPEFDIMHTLQNISNDVMGRNPPKVIHDRIMLYASCTLLNTAMKIKNPTMANKAVNDVNVNWHQFAQWAGEKAAGVQSALSNWVPF